MSGALFDLQRLISTDRAPGDAGRSEIVESDRLAGLVGDEELRALDLRELEATLQLAGELAIGRVDGEHASLAAALSMHGLKERKELRLDGHAPRDAGLGRLHLPRVTVDGAMDVDDAAMEVDVFPLQRVALAGPRIEVGHHRERLAPLERYVLARHEGEELRGIKVLLRLAHAAVGAMYALRGVGLADPKVALFGAACVGHHLRDEPPDVAGRLPRELLALDAPVEVLDEVLEVRARHLRHEERAEARVHVRGEALLVGRDGAETAGAARDDPSVGPEFHGLAAARIVALRLVGLAFLFLREELARLVLALLEGLGVELRTLPGALAASGRGVLVGDVNTCAGPIGEADARAVVDAATGALEGLHRTGTGPRHRPTHPLRARCVLDPIGSPFRGS